MYDWIDQLKVMMSFVATVATNTGTDSVRLSETI